MKRATSERLTDISVACAAIARHLAHADAAPQADDDLVSDAIRIRLVEIGEAVKDLDPAALRSEPDIPWAEIARMRDHLAHRYFDTTHAIVITTARVDVPLLAAAVDRLLRG